MTNGPAERRDRSSSGSASFTGGGPGTADCGWTTSSHPVAASTMANDAIDAAAVRTPLRMREPPGGRDVCARRIPAPQRPVVAAPQLELPVRDAEHGETIRERLVLPVERVGRSRVEPEVGVLALELRRESRDLVERR